MFDTASLFCAAFRLSPVCPNKPVGLGQGFVPGDLGGCVGLWPMIRAVRGYSTVLFGSLSYLSLGWDISQYSSELYLTYLGRP
jgi:hypothetical protein